MLQGELKMIFSTLKMFVLATVTGYPSETTE
jgi:hypothetical protein